MTFPNRARNGFPSLFHCGSGTLAGGNFHKLAGQTLDAARVKLYTTIEHGAHRHTTAPGPQMKRSARCLSIRADLTAQVLTHRAARLILAQPDPKRTPFAAVRFFILGQGGNMDRLKAECLLQIAALRLIVTGCCYKEERLAAIQSSEHILFLLANLEGLQLVNVDPNARALVAIERPLEA